MNTKTLKLNEQEIKKLADFLAQNAIQETTPNYALFKYRYQKTTIIAYASKKVVFQGDFIVNQTPKPKDTLPQMGSDEVGTGDYFGPIVVVACYVDKDDMSLLEKLKIKDSKKISDQDILEIAPVLMQKLKHTKLILDNSQYNELHKTNNMNKIKARLHNQALNLLAQKLNNYPFTVVDQFTPSTNYFNYLKDETNIYRDIHFETKAEDKYIAVACASIIARYIFLMHFDQMCQKYSFSFPKGAGDNVDKMAQKFVNAYGFENLTKVAKVHFKNTEKLEV